MGEELEVEKDVGGELEVEIRDNREWTFTIIENAIFENEKVTYKGLLTYLSLCSYGNKETHTCYPTIKSLAKRAKVSPDTVKRGLRELDELDIIDIEYRKDLNNPKKNTSNLYTIKGVGAHSTQGGCRETPGVGAHSTANYNHLELESLKENVEVGQALPDLFALKLFSKENPVFKDIKDKEWRSILRVAQESENDLRDVMIYVLKQFERGKRVQNIGGYMHRCLSENWSINFKDGDPWYDYATENDPFMKETASA